VFVAYINEKKKPAGWMGGKRFVMKLSKTTSHTAQKENWKIIL
jgi:hypothetical protein